MLQTAIHLYMLAFSNSRSTVMTYSNKILNNCDSLIKNKMLNQTNWANLSLSFVHKFTDMIIKLFLEVHISISDKKKEI